MVGVVSVTTSQRINADQLRAALGAGGFVSNGAALESTGSKVITPIGTTDAALTTAVATAAAAFVDYDGNRSTLTSRAANALAANATYLAIGSPTNAQVAAQVQLLTKECSGIIRLLLSQLDSTAGT